MPLSDENLPEVRRRVLSMLMDTIKTLRLIEENAEIIFGDRAAARIKSAINEYLHDFIDYLEKSRETHPEELIFGTSKERFQKAGLYGSQLDIKEHQVTIANTEVRESLLQRSLSLFRRPFHKWVDRINNFLRSLTAATGLSEALMELKDCLRDELPEHDQ